jgi:TatD DNase family protein
MFDTHCHPHLNKEKNKNDVINTFFRNWWKYMTVIWTNPITNIEVLKISKEYKYVFSSIWIHPCDIYELDLEKTINKLEEQIIQNKEKIVAIWECWLDYYWIYKDEKINKLEEKYKNKIIDSKKNLQKLFFKAQILLAKEHNLPIIIHNRDSKDDVLNILKELNFKNFIFHCYSEDLEYAKKLIKFSPECKISFSWIVTFKNAKNVQEVAKNINIKHILAETDSPYLTPTPLRWKEENEPLYTKYIIEKIEELRWEKCSETIMKNSINIFWLK